MAQRKYILRTYKGKEDFVISGTTLRKVDVEIDKLKARLYNSGIRNAHFELVLG
jgi:hypothetical protein